MCLPISVQDRLAYFKKKVFSCDVEGYMNKNGEVVWQTTVSEQTPFIVKFVLKLFQTYISSDNFLYLCNIIDVKLHRVFGHPSPKYNEHTARCGH